MDTAGGNGCKLALLAGAKLDGVHRRAAERRTGTWKRPAQIELKWPHDLTEEENKRADADPNVIKLKLPHELIRETRED